MTIRSASGAEEDFAAAYDAYADAIFRHCCFRCFNRERAKELMQDTFMRVWEYLASGNDIDNVQAFLYKTANNLLVDEARRAMKRHVVSLEDMQEAGFDIAGEDGRDEGKKFDAAQVAQILHTLEEPYRSTVVMRFIDELQPREIADVTGESANVISVRIHRGLKMLKTNLATHGYAA